MGNHGGSCRDFDGIKAGGWTFCGGKGCPSCAAPVFNQPARTDVEGCFGGAVVSFKPLAFATLASSIITWVSEARMKAATCCTRTLISAATQSPFASQIPQRH